MDHLHERQQAILRHLLENPDGATTDELRPVIGVTKTATKEHINRLQHMGYLSFRDVIVGVGRPKRVYSLSEKGMESFPKQYSWLSSALLSQLALDLKPQQISSIMKRIARSIAGELESELSNLTEHDRMVRIVKTMNDLGYHARLNSSETRKVVEIEALNCVYHSVAKMHPKLCEFDVEFLSLTSKRDVIMESCVALGGTSCRFCLSKRSTS